MGTEDSETAADGSPPRRSGIARIGGTICAVLAALALSGMALVMFTDVIGRYFFNHPVPGAGELIEILVAVTVFAALPLATARQEHIRLDYLEMAVGRTREHYVRAASWFVSAVVLAVLAWRVAMTTRNVIRYGDTTAYLHIPIAPFGVLITISIAFSAIVMTYLAWSELRRPGAAGGQGVQI